MIQMVELNYNVKLMMKTNVEVELELTSTSHWMCHWMSLDSVVVMMLIQLIIDPKTNFYCFSIDLIVIRFVHLNFAVPELKPIV